MISLKKCKEILNKNELKYSDEEIRIIGRFTSSDGVVGLS